MIKPLKVLATSSLLLMLGACNTNDNAAFDALQPGENQNNVGEHRGDNLGDAFQMRNGNHTAEGFNTGNRNNNNNITTDRVNYQGFDRNQGDNGLGFNQNNNRNTNNQLGGNMDDSISADFTTISSGKYPHTRAVQIQSAKYGYIVSSPQQGNSQQIRFTVPNVGKSPTQNFVQRFQTQTTIPGQQTGVAQPGQTQQQPRPQAQQQPRPQAQQPVQQPTQQAQPPAQQQPAAQAQPKQETQAAQPKPAAQTTQGISATEQKVIELTNVERRKNGLKDLIGDTKLSSVARTKSNDMKTKGYFSHTSPTYGSPFDMMRDFGVTYKTAGENIAQGQPTPEAVVQAWMNSEGHRKNILSANFTHIGVGHNTSGHYWTQMFIGK